MIASVSRARMPLGVQLVVAVFFGLVATGCEVQAGNPELEQDAVLRQAILTDYASFTLPSGATPGNLTGEQHRRLRSQIIDEYSRWFTGPLLTSRLSDRLAWADKIAKQPSPRTTTAHLDDYQVDSRSTSGDRAEIVGRYVIYHVTASVADDKGHEAVSGGWVTLQFDAEMVKVPNLGWRVSVYKDNPVKFVEDRSVLSGQEYLPTTQPTRNFPAP